MKITVALDSGAYSIYQRQAFKKTKRWQKNKAKTRTGPVPIDYSFYSTSEFDAYLEAYVDFVKKNPLEFYVTIDAINEPALSWDIYQRLRKAGLSPLPVWHAGEELKWLKKYLKCTDYVGFGGMGTGWVRQNYVSWARDGFRYIGKDIKVHGFAMTSLPLVRDLPWFSVDSSTPFYMSRCGTLLVPKVLRRNGKATFDYLAPHTHIAITDRRLNGRRHVMQMARDDQRATDDYLALFGATVEEAKTNDNIRELANFYRMHKMQCAVVEQLDRPFRYYMSSTIHARWVDYIENCKTAGVTSIYFLGTYFDPKQTLELLGVLKERRRPSIKHENEADTARTD